MKIEIAPRDTATLVHLQGQLDSNAAPTLEKRLMAVLNEQADAQSNDQPNALILDCSATDYVSSAGLRVLLVVAKHCRQQQRRFMLCAVNDEVMQVLQITGFQRVLELQPDLDQALAAADASASPLAD